ncbi:MAG: diaminopimelate epimerase [Acholeplasmatales bacterium]|nr:diaminopimelate epimerase [Acholeplasmatales bacterium]
MEIKFTKMHGCGNDYIYINCFNLEIKNPNKLSEIMSPRHFSVGADGVVLILKSNIADAKMRMFNLDGSEGKMCGNAIRCIGKYLYDNKLVNKTEISIETLSGIKYLKLNVSNNMVDKVSVDMGYASFEPKNIPLLKDKEMINEDCFINDSNYKITAVSMGNPHAVIYLDEIENLELEKIGPIFENNKLFPERVNTEFIKIVDKNHLEMRVWERGSGETYACGTGACATVAASVRNGICDFDEEVYVKLVGGSLEIKCLKDYKIIMTGPATKVYDGVFEYED